MIRGTVVTQRRRCGKPNCHCADGTVLHESTVLSYTENDRSRTVMLRPGEVVAVRAATGRYRAALAEIERQGNAGPRRAAHPLDRRPAGRVSGFTAMLGAFRAVFTAPGFAIFTDLLTGWVCAPGRRTITGMIAVADPERRRAHDAYHRSTTWRHLTHRQPPTRESS